MWSVLSFIIRLRNDLFKVYLLEKLLWKSNTYVYSQCFKLVKSLLMFTLYYFILTKHKRFETLQTSLFSDTKDFFHWFLCQLVSWDVQHNYVIQKRDALNKIFITKSVFHEFDNCTRRVFNWLQNSNDFLITQLPIRQIKNIRLTF